LEQPQVVENSRAYPVKIFLEEFMKKLVVVLLAATLIIGFAGCTKKTDTANNVARGFKPDGKIVFICSALGDLSFTDSGAAGMEVLKSQGWKTQIVEVGEDASKFEASVRDYSEDPDVTYILVNSGYLDVVDVLAPNYPDKRYIIYDIGRDTKVASNNILYLVYAQNEGSYLVGMIAAAISKTGVISTVGGVENPVICDFITGFIEGAKAQNPNIKVATGWVGSWTNTAAMLENCITHYNTSKADVFFPVAGSASTGAFEAAAQIGKGVWTIGVDSDQYTVLQSKGRNELANTIYTSMLKEVGNSIVSIFNDQKAGNEYWGTVRTLGIKENAVGFANNAYFKSLADPALITKLETTRAAISAGTLQVTSYFDFKNGMADYNNYVNSVKP
jgi:basic membrane protein A